MCQKASFSVRQTEKVVHTKSTISCKARCYSSRCIGIWCWQMKVSNVLVAYFEKGLVVVVHLSANEHLVPGAAVPVHEPFAWQM